MMPVVPSHVKDVLFVHRPRSVSEYTETTIMDMKRFARRTVSR